MGAGIDGTWKADIDSVQFDQKPDEFLLQAGQYSCKTCTPSFTVAADGAFHPITSPYSDSLSVKVVDDHNVLRVSKKGDRQTGETKMTVSADGNSLTNAFTDSSVPDAPPTKGEVTETRVGLAPSGAHAVSGKWKPAKLANFNAEALTFTFKVKVNSDTFRSSSPNGVSYDAKLGGAAVPITGDTAGTAAAVTKLNDTSYRETDSRGGKVINVVTFTLGGDGKLNAVAEDKEAGTTTRWTATRQ